MQHAWVLLVSESAYTLQVGIGARLLSIPRQNLRVGLGIPANHEGLRSIADDGIMVIGQVDETLPALQEYNVIADDEGGKLWNELDHIAYFHLYFIRIL